jgi:hypothetical protein
LADHALNTAVECGFYEIDRDDDTEFHGTKVRNNLQLRDKIRNFAPDLKKI